MGVAGALAGIPNGTMLLLDGQSGTIVLEPNPDELEEAKVQVSRRHRLELQLETVVGRACGDSLRTSYRFDGQCGSSGGDRDGDPRAEGVGLLRTEFLLTGRAGLPTEE